MGTTEDYIETVLTCEGDLYDPEFETQLLQLKQRLQDLISPNAKKLQIKKVEPWNSVKITFDIPREAAVRLKQLAEQGDHTLKQLGILSVQIEGDQSISLTIAGKNNETTELVFRTGLSSSLQSHNVPASHTGAAASSEPFEMGSSDHPLPDPSDVEATRKNIARYLGGHSNAVPMLADMFDPHSSEGKFKVPSSVGMQGNDGLPHSSPANRSPAHPSLPSPGAMSAIRPPPSYSSAAAAAAFQQHQGLYVGSGHQQGQMSPVSPKYPTPPPSVSNPNSPGLRVGNTPLSLPMQGGVHGPQVNPIMNNMARLMGQKDITSSSPLLVNLLQNDANALGHFNNLAQHGKLQFPFDSGPPPKKKRKPRKQKDKGSISVDQSVSGNMDIIGMSTIPLQDRVPVSGEPAIGLGQFMRSQNATPPSQNTGYFGHNIMNRSPDDKHRHIINPITGQLELVDDDSSSSSLARPESTASAVSLDTGPPLSQLHPPPNPLVALQQSKLFPTLSSSALTLSSPQLSVSSDSSSHAKQLVRSQESFTSLQREQLQHHGLTQQLPMFSGGNVQGSKVTSVQANVSLPQPHVLEHSSSSTIASPVITTITSVACGAVGISSMSGHRHHPTLSTNEHNLPAHSEQNPVSQQSLVSTRINRQPVATVESSGTVYHDPSIHEKASVHGQVPHSIRQSHPSVTTSSLSLLGQMVHSQFPAPISAHSTTMMKQAALALTTLAQAAHEKLNQQQPPSIQQCTVPSPNQPSLVDNQVLPTQETPPNSADTQSNISSDNHSLSSQSSPGPHPQSSACNADSSFEPQNNVPKEGEPNDKNDPGSESDYKEQLSGLSVDTPNAEQKDTMVESETVADIAHEAGIQIVEDPHNTETVCASEVTHGEGAQSEPVVASPLSTLSSENRSPVHSVSPHLDHKDNIIEHHEDMDIKDSLVKNGNEISKESPTYGSGSTNGPTSMDSADSGVSMSEKKDAPSNGGIDSYDVYTSDQAGPVSNIDSQEKEFEQDGKLGITGKISKPVSPQLVHNSVVNHDSVLSNHTDEPFESDTEIHKNQDTCSPTESANKLQDIHQETTSNSLSKNVITVGYAMSNENPTNTILQSDVTSKLFTSATKKHVIDDSVPFLMRPFSKLSPSEVKEHTGSFSSIDQSLNWMGRSDLNPGGKRGDGVGLHSLQFSKVPISPINGEDQNNSEFKLWLGGKLQTQNNNKPDIKETQTLFSEKSSISSDKGLEEPKSEEKRDLSHLESSFDSQAKKG